MSPLTDAPPLTADRDLDRVAATLCARFDREAIASASRPEPVPNLSPSDGSSLEVPNTLEVPSLPPVAAREVPLIRPGAAARRAPTRSPLARSPRPCRGLRYAREETARLAARPNARARTPERRKCRSAARRPGRVARRRPGGDVLEHAIDVVRERHRCAIDRSPTPLREVAKSPRVVRARRAGGAAYRGARAMPARRGIRPGVERRGVRPRRSSARPLSTGSAEARGALSSSSRSTCPCWCSRRRRRATTFQAVAAP